MTETQATLVENNLKLVYHLVWKLGCTDFVNRNRDDLTSEGMVGLIKAAKAFDPVKGTTFATFASHCINNEMLMYIRRNKKHEGNVSLYSCIGRDGAGNEVLLLDNKSAGESDIDRMIRAEIAASDISELMPRLSDKEKMIICYLRQKMTQRAMAAELGYSQSYISRLVKKMRVKCRPQRERSGIG